MSSGVLGVRARGGNRTDLLPAFLNLSACREEVLVVVVLLVGNRE